MIQIIPILFQENVFKWVVCTFLFGLVAYLSAVAGSLYLSWWFFFRLVAAKLGHLDVSKMPITFQGNAMRVVSPNTSSVK